MRTVFLLPVPTQPRYKKRIDGLKQCGAEETVFAFERDYLKHGGAGLTYRKLGNVQNRRYWKRIPVLLAAIRFILPDVRRSLCVYCFGQDVALIAVLAHWLTFWHRTQIVLEVADIRPALLGSSPKARLLRLVERVIIGRCSRVVVTSPDFVSSYFVAIQRQPESRFFVIENKLDAEMPVRASASSWDGARPLRIGYFGLLRDATSWAILVSAVQQFSDRFQLVVYGRPVDIPDFAEDVRSHAGINYGGEYAWPADLPKLYGDVDIVWACYPKTPELRVGDLWKWPMTNRFYEGCAFVTPMVSQEGSADGRRIRSLGIGMTVDTDFPENTLNALLAVTPAMLAQWRAALDTLPANVYRYGDEHCRLLSSLQGQQFRP